MDLNEGNQPQMATQGDREDWVRRLNLFGDIVGDPAAIVGLDPDELLAWCAPRMANYKVPRRAVVVDALPVNASGKVLKYELRERV